MEISLIFGEEQYYINISIIISKKISLESLPTDYKKSVHVYCGVRTGFHLLEYC